MKKTNLISVLFAASLIASPTVSAAVISYAYTANQDFASVSDLNNVAGAASTFTTISGVISYDTGTPDTDPDPISGQYLTGNISVNEFATPAYAFSMSIYDGASSEQFSLGGMSGTEGVLLSFQAFSGDAFSSDELPNTLTLNSFNALNELQFFSANGFTQFTVTSLTLDMPQVPVPAALPLFLSAIAGLRLFRRSR